MVSELGTSDCFGGYVMRCHTTVRVGGEEYLVAPRKLDSEKEEQGAKSNQWALWKLKSFCKTQDMVNKTKWKLTESEKIITHPTPQGG